MESLFDIQNNIIEILKNKIKLSDIHTHLSVRQLNTQRELPMYI